MSADYQILIVGSGISGLHCALRLSHAFPKFKIAVADSYKTTGGRIATYSEGRLQWEAGAGRIANSHTMTNKYVDKYKLTRIPIGGTQDWVSANQTWRSVDTWTTFADFLIKFLSPLGQKVLAAHTPKELLMKYYGMRETNKMMKLFPYVSELNTLRADLALQAFKAEMHSPEGFFVVREGLSTITNSMQKELEKRGVDFLLNHRLSAIEKDSSPIVCKFAGERGAEHVRLAADKVILAIPSKALKQISPFKNLPILKHLSMRPLLRIYAAFPKPVWFQGMRSVITDSPLRYVIPVNEQKGVMMVSYTDGDDTRHWQPLLHNGEGTPALKGAIMEELRKLFPKKHVPEPLALKTHSWQDGATYWLPGLYEPEVASERIMRPLPGTWSNLYVCGESYSMRQAWIEGALEHSEKMLKKYFL